MEAKRALKICFVSAESLCDQGLSLGEEDAARRWNYQVEPKGKTLTFHFPNVVLKMSKVVSWKHFILELNLKSVDLE